MDECEKCGGKNMYMTVSLMFKMPAIYEGHITKKVLAKKEAELMAANWDRVIYYCKDCGKRQKGWED